MLRGIVLALALLTMLVNGAWAEEGTRDSASPEAVQAERTAEEGTSLEGEMQPLLSKPAAALGLVLLFAMGAITSRRQDREDEAGHCRSRDEEPVGDPYSRLADGAKKKRCHWFRY